MAETGSQYLATQEAVHGKVVHRCPPKGSGVMPCCGRTPFEVPRWHRMTLDPESVTCGGGRGTD